MTRYAVYGGSFNPVHYGHLSIVERAIAMGYDVLMVPAYRHAFGKQSAPFEHRLRMCELALQDCGLQQHAQVCALEATLAHDTDTPVYTYDVLCAVRDRLHVAPCLLVGPDIAAEWPRWYRHDAIDREFGRVSLAMTYDVRSTDIRQRLVAGEPPASLQASMPAPVCAYIARHTLYRDTA